MPGSNDTLVAGDRAAGEAPGSVRAAVIELALNVALPYGVYLLLRRWDVSQAHALVLSAVPPLAVAAMGFVRRRRIDMLSVLVITTTVLALIATVLSDSGFVALVRHSLVTGTLAIVFALSLAAPRPMLFYLSRDTTCRTAEAANAFEARWSRPAFRRFMRELTVVWAFFLAAEAALRLILASIWPNPALIAATQIAWVVLPILLVRWSIREGRRRQAAKS